MNLLHDHHIHTVYSGHSTPDMIVGAIVARAEKVGLRRIVIVEHVPEVGIDRDAVLAGCVDPNRRPQIDAIAADVHHWRGQSPVRVLIGAEVDADPIRMDGSLLLQNLEGMDVVLASTHYLPSGVGVWYEMPKPLPEEMGETLYRQWMAWTMHVAANPKVDILAHPGVEMASIGAIGAFTGSVLDDFGKLLQVCRKYNTAFELNELVTKKMPPQALETYADVFGVAKEVGARISIGSDAHQLDRIGNYEWVRTVVERFDIGPDDLFHPGIRV